ncbi:hypothetical protein GCM10027037_33090 [Mucilaginibacter koreensis]
MSRELIEFSDSIDEQCELQELEQLIEIEQAEAFWKFIMRLFE